MLWLLAQMGKTAAKGLIAESLMIVGLFPPPTFHYPET